MRNDDDGRSYSVYPEAPRGVLDACVLINILASGEAAAIARANGLVYVVASEVSAETHFIREDDGGRRKVDLLDLREAGLLEVIALRDEERDLSSRSSSRALDEGEAASIALAISRGLPIATDDRKALRVVAARGLGSVYRTTGLIRKLCDEDPAVAPDILIARVRTKANYAPNASDQDIRWWCESS